MQSPWHRLKTGGTLVGSFLSFGSPLNAEIMGMAGFDLLIIDLEHGACTEAAVLPQLQALAASGTAVVVRVESHEQVRTHRILDLGAHGIMFPRVNSAEDARAVVRNMHYPPKGVRGVAAMVRASGYGSRFPEYLASDGAGLLTIVQIETEQAVAKVEEIAAVEGVDVLFVGPMDLSRSMGIYGEFDNPRFVAALEATVAAAGRHGLATAILMRTADDFERYRGMGFRLLTCGTDASLLAAASRTLADSLRKKRDAATA